MGLPDIPVFWLFLIFGSIIFIIFGIGLFLIPNGIQKEDQEFTKGDKIAQQVLNDTNVSCDKIVKLRLDRVNGKINFYMSTEDQLRHIYNIKNCGTHWGWFEP